MFAPSLANNQTIQKQTPEKTYRLKPLPPFAPDLDKPKAARHLGVLEDVEEQTLGLGGARGPDGAVRGLEGPDVVGRDVELDKERELFLGRWRRRRRRRRRHGDFGKGFGWIGSRGEMETRILKSFGIRMYLKKSRRRE